MHKNPQSNIKDFEYNIREYLEKYEKKECSYRFYHIIVITWLELSRFLIDDFSKLSNYNF